MLRTARLDVESYPSAAAFLDALPTAKLSCVITDVRMPGMSGIDLLRRLKELKIEVPVIVITANSHAIVSKESGLAGGAFFMTKPFSPAQLLNEIRRLLPLAG